MPHVACQTTAARKSDFHPAFLHSVAETAYPLESDDGADGCVYALGSGRKLSTALAAATSSRRMQCPPVLCPVSMLRS
jgi:hypothetical protein